MKELRYGSLITLSTSDNCFVYSKGFIDNSIYLQEFNDCGEPDFSGSIFRLLPQYAHSIQTDLLKSVRELTPLAFQDKLMRQDDSLEGELKTNIQTFSNLKGQPVKFGSVVQLEHVLSHKFLTVAAQQSADLEKDNLKLLLTDFASEYSHFRIEPCYKFQREGETCIQEDEKIVLEILVPELGKIACVHCSSAEVPHTFQFSKIIQISTQVFAENDKLFDLGTVKEVNASLDTKTKWNLSIFAQPSNQSNRLSVGDFVWLTHSEEEVCLTTRLKVFNEQKFKLVFSKKRDETNGLWKLEALNEKAGGFIEYGQGYRLKHISTGLYLSIETHVRRMTAMHHFSKLLAKQAQHFANYKMTLAGKNDPHTVWTFQPFNDKRPKHVSKDEYFVLMNVETKLILQVTKKDQFDERNRLVPVFSTLRNEHSYFKGHKSDDTLVCETLFLLNCKPIIKGFPAFVENFLQVEEGDSRLVKYKDFKKYTRLLKSCLTSLDQFCQNKLQSMILMDKQYGEIQSSRQQIIREQDFIESLAEILNSCYIGPFSLKRIQSLASKAPHPELVSKLSTDVFDIEDLAAMEMAEVAKKIFQLLMNICFHNQESQQQAFNYFKIFRKHAGYDVGASRCLTSILQDNESLLLKLHAPVAVGRSLSPDDSIIAHYIWLLRRFNRERKPQLLEFLKSVCIFKGRGMSVNQEKIHELLFGNPENYSKAIITTVLDSDDPTKFKLTLQHPSGLGEDMISLENCFNEPYWTPKLQRELNYFTRMLDLFADMCKGRNYICKSSIKDWFPIDALLGNMWNNELPVEIRAAFAKLMLSIYIDSYPRQETKRPELIRVLRLVSKYDEKLLYREKHVIMRLDSQYDIQNVGRRFTTDKGPLTRRTSKDFVQMLRGKTREDTAVDEDDETIEIDAETATLHTLRMSVLKYFTEQKPDFDILTYEILHMASKMARFELFGAHCTDLTRGFCVINPRSAKFQREQMDIVQLVRAVKTLLFHRISEANEILDEVEDNKKMPFSYSFLSSLLGLSNSLADPTVRYAISIKNYLSSISLGVSQQDPTANFEMLCRLEICELLCFLMDWRQDFLLKNVVEWFNKIGVSEVESSDFLTLIPPIIDPGVAVFNPELNQTLKKLQSTQFIAYSTPEIPDINCYQESIIPLLIKLYVATEDYSVQTSILRVLYKSFHQRFELARNLHHMHVMTMLQDTDLFSWIKINLSTFQQYSEQSELWLKYWQQPTALMQKNLQKFDIVFSILDHFNNLLYQDTSIEAGIPRVGRRQEISADRQTMLYYLGVHEFIINLIRDGMHSLIELVENPALQVHNEPRIRLSLLFKNCHYVLTQFVKDNPRNQKALSKHLDLFTAYLRIPVGQISLICAMFENNWELCSQVNEPFLKCFVNLISTEGRQVQFLKIFELVQIVNGEPLKDIQRLVLMTLLQAPNKFHILYMNANGEFTFEEGTGGSRYKDEPFNYHANLLKVFMNCGKGVVGVYLNEAKCQKILPLRSIFQLLDAAESDVNYAKLKIPLLEYFYDIYIDTEKKYHDLCLFKPFLQYMRTQADKIGRAPSKEYLDLPLVAIYIRILYLYSERFIKSDDDDNLQSQEDLATVKYCATAIVRIWDFVEPGQLSRETIDEAYQLIHTFGMYIKYLNNVREQPDDSFILEFQEDNDTIKASWLSFIDQFIYSQELKEQLKAERKTFLVTLYHIKDFLDGVTYEDFIKKLISYIRMSNSLHSPSENVLNCLNVLTTFIKQPTDFKNPEPSGEIKRKLQNKLTKMGAVRVTLALMCDPTTSQSVFEALLQLCVRLLDGGNNLVQQEFYQYFINMPNSEVFFRRIHQETTKFIEVVAFKLPPDNNRVPIYRKRNKLIRNILRLLQLLCENHNLPLQNYLRNQEKSRNNYDLVSLTTQLLAELMKKKYFKSFLIISQCFDTLTEFVQGPCFENQKAIIESSFLEVLKGLLSLDECSQFLKRYDKLIVELSHRTTVIRMNSFQDKTQFFTGWVVAHLKCKALVTVLSLLEGNTDTYIITRIMRTINVEILHENLVSTYNSYVKYYGENYYDYDVFNHHENNSKYKFGVVNDQDKNPKYYQVILEIGLYVYHLLRVFDDYSKTQSSIPKSREGAGTEGNRRKVVPVVADDLNLQSSLAFFDKLTGSVEVIFLDGRLCRVYFWIPPEGLYLTNEIKETFHSRVDRSSDKSKLLYLQQSSLDLFDQMFYEKQLAKTFSKYKWLKVFSNHMNLWRDLAFFMTFLLNFMIIFSYANSSTSHPEFFFHLHPLGIDTALTELLFTIFGLVQFTCAAIIVFFFILKNAPVLLRKGLRDIKLPIKPSRLTKICLFFKKLYWGGMLLVKNVFMLYHFLYLVFSFLGILVHPFFFAWHLLDVVYRYTSLQNVIKSIVKPREALILTFVLTIVLIYIFGLWGYASFEDDIGDRCNSLWTCIVTVFDQGFKNDGGIGGFIDREEIGDVKGWRVLFDNMYNIIIMIVMMNIVQGIIIDTFAVLRSAQEKNSEDRLNKCFICGIDKETIERSTNSSFKRHTGVEHNEWNYLLFITYLEKKEQTEYTGIESHVKDRINKKDINWFPQHQALSITDFFDSDEKIINDKIEALQGDMNLLKKDLAEIKAALQLQKPSPS